MSTRPKFGVVDGDVDLKDIQQEMALVFDKPGL